MAALTVGSAITEITPPLGLPMAGYGARDQLSQSVVDPLYAQVLWLQAGDFACALVCCDLIGLRADFVAEVRARAAARCSVAPEDILICCSHTHWGPVVTGGEYLARPLREAVSEEYRAALQEKLVQLIVQAEAARVPAVAGWDSGFAERITFNRRQVGPDFQTRMQLVLEPSQALVASEVGNELAQAWQWGEHMGPRLSEPLEELDGYRVGPADAEVPVLRLDRADGAPLATLINFACHAVCGGGDFYGYSADFIGPAREAFAALTGSALLFTAGCAGDQVPRWRQNDARQRVGKSLAAEAARVWLGIEERWGELPIAVTQRVVHLPVNPKIPSEAEAQAAWQAHPEPDSPKAAWERQQLALARQIARLEEGFPAELWAMRIGDCGLVGLPGEVLVEIGLQIKQRSPFAVTFPISLANDAIGYLPTDYACREGGYEPNWTPVGPGTERVLVETAVALLKELA